MKAENFVSYKNFRWLKICLAALLLSLVIYFWDQPLAGRSGASLVGYIYGIIAAFGIVYLLYYGARKRSYNVSSNLQNSLSAHTWIGIFLIFLVPLHTGFEFGYNIHSFAYYIMVFVIVSGIWGAVNYVRLPKQVPSHRGGSTAKELTSEIQEIELEIQQQAEENENIRLLQGSKDMTSALAEILEEDRENALALIKLIKEKTKLEETLKQEVKVQRKLKFWLYFHLPLSILLALAVGIHVFLVVYYGS